MRFIFVDAENIGLKEVESIGAAISDKVFVFSKSDSIKETCERNLFLYISSYPTGANQADFYIIGNLVGIIASLTDQQRDICQFVLYSKDSALITAFTFQCKLHKAKCRIVLEPKNPATPQPKPQQKLVPEKASSNLETRILDLLKTAQTAESVRKKLKQQKPEFTRALNNLIKTDKIKRDSKNKKTWTAK